MNVLLFLHVLGVVMFLGNIVTAAFWKIKAERDKDIAHLHKVTRNVMVADFIFTLPGILLIIVTGNILTVQLGYSMSELNWVSISQGMFILTGILWAVILIPCQLRMIKESKKSVSLGELTPAYKKASRYWDVCGVTATLIPFVVLYLMLVKPF